MTMKEDFGKYIRNRRLELRLTQLEVAKKADVAQNFIAYLENGQRKPSTEMVRKLSEILQLPSDRLYFLAHEEDLQGVIAYDREGGIRRKIPPVLTNLLNDRSLRARHRITEEEVEMLASIRGRGEIRTKEDYVFLLMSIRQVMR